MNVSVLTTIPVDRLAEFQHLVGTFISAASDAKEKPAKPTASPLDPQRPWTDDEARIVHSRLTGPYVNGVIDLLLEDGGWLSTDEIASYLDFDKPQMVNGVMGTIARCCRAHNTPMLLQKRKRNGVNVFRIAPTAAPLFGALRQTTL